MIKENSLINEDTGAYTSTEVKGMVKETKKGKVVIRSHFKSKTQEELDMKISDILEKLINKELEAVK